jgi:antitoxin component of MazEF toxin-antitoxin module
MVLAQAMGFEAGEIVEWVVEDHGTLVVKRERRRKGKRIAE